MSSRYRATWADIWRQRQITNALLRAMVRINNGTFRAHFARRGVRQRYKESRWQLK